ncbi:MAG: hypothetical protein AAF599_02105 [Bacteroidota bacterium]
MSFPLSVVKVLKSEFETILLDKIWTDLLLAGQFYEFENLLHKELLVLYDKLSEAMIRLVSLSPCFVEQQQSRAATK